MDLSITEVIRKKRDGLELSPEEIHFLIESTLAGKIDDYQIGAMLMAIYLNKMNFRETVSLTKSMVDTGEILTFPKWKKDILVDKHSTGGVGDKISLVLTPALAACGLKVPMISGRGLEHTGGTLDKLESIPGFQVALDFDRMNECLSAAGCFICGASRAVAPADAILYKARDITCTVCEYSLIVGSILSKKAAEGIGTLAMNVTYGTGAFVKTEAEAQQLGELLKTVGKGLNIDTQVLVSEMNTPVGSFVGNSLEIIESIMCLRNEARNSVTELVKMLGGVILKTRGVVETLEQGQRKIEETLENFSALESFRRMLVSQGVSEANARDLCSGEYWKVLPRARHITQLRSPRKGVVNQIDALDIGRACWKLGAGRSGTDTKIDHSVGVVLLKTVGQTVGEGEPWIEIHHSTANLPEQVDRLIRGSLSIGAVRDDKISLKPRFI